MRILLVEDDLLLAKATALGLDQANFVVDIAGNAQVAEHFLSVYSYHIVLLDLGLPDKSGLEILKYIRSKNSNIGILILTAQDRVQDRISGLKAGADDFITKPYDLDEVIARIQAIVRRMSGSVSDIFEFRNIVINKSTQQVSVNNIPIDLSQKEYDLLQLLMVNQGRIVTKRMLEDSIYTNDDVNSNVLQVHIHNLRRKLGKDIVRTIKGLGYIVDNNQ
ncbi:response regulator [Acinetobacter sp. CAAS 2-6]|uniref:response regulator n=1 Tax=Acinetobacter sp. CAAS 2-6 TaxID=3016358 RepID=UPI002DD67914|nr:response regulator [Acinetobacter sp. CAAS 2-6]